ncbi:DUF2461 domain-containing protein [Myceligenerans crystallogenes]|uniref:DUF2461 domain-containing protein n=1 Tax=Myceligenerans crystallogenes TaxID=316335 RepID=A0ABP4ZNM6_9MICO
MAFTGIPTAALDFYEDLEADNSKAFWTARKDVYERSVREPLLALAEEVEDEFGPGKYFRPYRDVRFSKDKSPYKTQQGIWFGESSRYVHVSAAGLFVAGGYWRTSREQLTRLRRAVALDTVGPDLVAAVGAVTAAGLTVDGERLRRVPPGFDKEHPRGDLLRHKTLTCGRDLGSPDWLTTPRAKDEIVTAWRAMEPLVAWLERHVGRDD